MLADPEVAERVAFQDGGVVGAISAGKRYARLQLSKTVHI